MTKGQIKYTVYDNLNSGTPNDGSDLWSDDLDPYIVMAVNKIMHDQFYFDQNAEQGDRTVQTQLLQVYENVAVTKSISRNRYQAVLPFKIISLPRGRGLQYVGSMAGKQFIAGQQSEEGLEEFYQDFKKDKVTYYLEGPINGSQPNTVTNLYFYGLPSNVNKILVKALVNITTLADTDDIQIPSGKEIDLIDLVTKYFSQQRLIPKDMDPDHFDNTEQPGK